MKQLFFAILGFFSISVSINAQDLSQKLPFDSALRVGKLSNGLTYYIRHNEKPEKPEKPVKRNEEKLGATRI